eukprot:CAMPEP_0206403230 /NCGR_PEP_ID=MMETSP0294-20121207/27527_1 /ASSEMBLY_ACC=CAM_ASM_000327 /TAXON_ID=39354 /ORGANISM="Heterosigma akashiwo, Strain CCMP2393" /LENGTH=75 /DNA_ID=CAMNT_0053860653 /DNA_START=99 /DNA_END=323 /DNA_ORIENTATION=-
MEGMVDVKRYRCGHAGCRKQNNFAYEGERRGRFCAEHKLEGMVNVRSKRCEHEGCIKQPRYNFEGQKKSGRFCLE